MLECFPRPRSLPTIFSRTLEHKMQRTQDPFQYLGPKSRNFSRTQVLNRGPSLRLYPSPLVLNVDYPGAQNIYTIFPIPHFRNTYIHAYGHVYMRAYLHICIHNFIIRCIVPCMHAYMHTCIISCMYSSLHTYIYSCIRV